MEYVGGASTIQTDPFGHRGQAIAPPIKADEYPPQSVEGVIAALCDCECLKCTRQECLQEASEIAAAYKKIWESRKTWRHPIRYPNDYRSGWMCYQWQHWTYTDLLPTVSGGKCFDIQRVGRKNWIPPYRCKGKIGYEIPGHWTDVAHNWVAITVWRRG